MHLHIDKNSSDTSGHFSVNMVTAPLPPPSASLPHLHHCPTSTAGWLRKTSSFFFLKTFNVGFSWGCEESDMTEWLHFHFSLLCTGEGNGNPPQCLAWRIPGTGSHRVGHNWSDLAAAMWVFCPMFFTNSPSTGAWRAHLWPGRLRCPCLELPLEGEAGLCHGSPLALWQAELGGDCRLGLSIYSWGLSN